MIGAIQAGGKSLRMGRDKAWVDLNGEPLITRVLSAARPVVDRLMIIISDSCDSLGRFSDLARLWDAELRVDVYPDRGPLAGIHATLAACPEGDSALVLACDLPFISTEMLRVLRNHHERVKPSITVPVSSDGRLQPLASIYSDNCKRAVEKQLAEGKLRVDLLFDLLRTHRVLAADYSHLAGCERFFLNVNSPSDLSAIGPTAP